MTRLRTHLLVIAAVGGLLIAALGSPPATRAANTINVPEDFPSIQAAINAATPGDTVRVAPGTYLERIRIDAKEITVESSGGPEATTIDGAVGGTVAIISALPGESPVLRGFTITNGYGSGAAAGGVVAAGGPAIIENNIIRNNYQGGVGVSFADTLVRQNVIADNWNGGAGGGIYVGGSGMAQITGNTITRNSSGQDGGGIALNSAGTPTIAGNTISSNSAYGWGGGISLGNQSDARIFNNLIAGNSAGRGGGIGWLVPRGTTGPSAFNNTIVGNTASMGSGVFADGFDVASSFIDNVVIGATAQPTIECGSFNDLNPPIIVFNDVVNTAGPKYGGSCTDRTGSDGNVSVDPAFVDPASGDYHLSAGSPLIDAGRNDGAPTEDIDGDARPLDGNGDGVAVVDPGFDEFRAPDAVPPTVAYTGNAGTYAVDEQVDITCTATDNIGVVWTDCANIDGLAWTFGLGSHPYSASATDAAGNTGYGSTTFDVIATYPSMTNLTNEWVLNAGVAKQLASILAAAARAEARGNLKAEASILGEYRALLRAQSGKAITAAHAKILADLSYGL